MNTLIVYCHPCEESFNAALKNRVVETLEKRGDTVHVIDLYADGFNPVMSGEERRCYNDQGQNEEPVADQLQLIQWAEMMVFVYPTWWFGLPAMLKGWFDRVWVPHVTFTMPDGQGPLSGNMRNIRKIAIVTTCGASWLASKFIGEPGRRTIFRGLKNVCCPDSKCLYLAHYKMDSSTPESRAKYLDKVAQRLARF